jgi:anti-anti-sigma regulatory factor
MANELFFQPAAEIVLGGYVDRKAARQLVRVLRRRVRQRPRTRFLLDCSMVEDFCGYALAEFVNARRSLQWQGADMELAGCSPYLKSRLAVPLFESLLMEEPSYIARSQTRVD